MDEFDDRAQTNQVLRPPCTGPFPTTVGHQHGAQTFPAVPEDVAHVLLDLRLQLGHLRLQEDVEVVEVRLHRFIDFGKTGGGHFIGLGLGAEGHIVCKKAGRWAGAKSNT